MMSGYIADSAEINSADFNLMDGHNGDTQLHFLMYNVSIDGLLSGYNTSNSRSPLD